MSVNGVESLMNQPFGLLVTPSAIDLYKDISLLTGLLRMSFGALVIIDNDNHD